MRNLVERAVILCSEDHIQTKHLPEQIVTPDPKPVLESEHVVLGRSLHQIEKEVIFKTLKMTKHNKTKAAKTLEISLKTLHNKLNKYYLERETQQW